MLARSVLITGCNRGLGLEFVKQLAESVSPPKFIIGTCRDIGNAAALSDIATKFNNVHILQADVTDESQYCSLVAEVEKMTGTYGLNLLINNAGVAPKSTRINMVKSSQMKETLLVNTVAPLMLTKAFLPLLRKAAAKSEGANLSVQRAAVVNMSSVLGSIEENDQGGLYPYRASKAALNAITKSLSLDLQRDNILVASLHPGWVRTDMGGKNAPLSTEESISQMLATIAALNENSNGSFVQYDGRTLPW
ncbi:C-signal-like [Oratosquilla oratoria]|uniref:C-signal-like n=1 Tax=Oratosquilla oratoria TaxID=337810 RepID=UPI003F76EA6C